MTGLLFGFIDNFVLLLGSYFGLEVDKYFEGNGLRGAVIGAGLGNALSDGVGALIDPAMDGMFIGITLGCLLALLLIPIMERFKTVDDDDAQPDTAPALALIEPAAEYQAPEWRAALIEQEIEYWSPVSGEPSAVLKPWETYHAACLVPSGQQKAATARGIITVTKALETASYPENCAFASELRVLHQCMRICF